MRGRLLSTLILFLALSLVLGLVVTLAPDAGAQDSVTAPDGPATWTRHNIPAQQDLQATCCANAVLNGFGLKFEKPCCITTGGCPPPGPDAMPGVEPAVSLAGGQGRWICFGTAQ